MTVWRWIRRLHGSRALRRSRNGEATGQQKAGQNGGISTAEISAISSSFVSRTKELEPGIEVKQLAQIRQEFQERYEARYLKPSKQWLRQSGGATSVLRNKYLVNESPSAIQDEELRFQSSELLRRPLHVGDIVLLKQHSKELSLCVDVPASTADPRYTFATVDGTLKFASRGSVLLRIPHSLAREYRGRLLLREAKYDYSAVGTIKNSADETIVLPTLVRQLVTSHLPQQISKLAWNKLPVVLKKLEILHRHLQNFDGPVSFPFLKLVGIVQDMKVEQGDELRKLVDVATSTGCVDSSTFLATYWGLQSQQKIHLWGEIQMNRALLSPVAVSILPFESQHLYYVRVTERLKLNNYKEVEDFARAVNGNEHQELVSTFPHVIRLLKDYAAGNFQNNEAVISLIAKIFRKIDTYRDSDISRDSCHELIANLLPAEKHWNPMHSNLTLGLPASSRLCQAQQQLYEMSSPSETSDSFERFDFGGLRVYCIDSEDAHEIDDGISIEEHGKDRFTLHIHIADPSSLFDESKSSSCNGIKDVVLKIASKKCFTTYLPDCVAPMLPKSYCNAADLGKQNQKTKTVSFSVDVIAPENGPIELLSDTFRLRLGEVSQFPKVTYDIVDSYLRNNDAPSVEQRELRKLHHISKLLREKRVKTMDAVIFGDGFNKGMVKVSGDNENISFEDKEETGSVILVTEMMILANTLSGKFFHENKIPGVFRSYQSLPLGERAQTEYDTMKTKIKKGKLPSHKDMTLLSSFLNSSFYSDQAHPHEMIGASQYLTVTSPLRRFPDLINHLQIHRYLRGLPMCFTDANIAGLTDDIQARDSILKTASRQGASYWTLRYFKDCLKGNPNQSFEVMVTSVPQVGLVRCLLPSYPSARGTLKLKPNETKFPAIGDIVTNCKITKIDCLDGILEFEIPTN